ncbi:MAG: tRNA (adenosine(37)-N6)-threonylcarbamoyltransferase complex transferase subunit TsaD [Pseudomonadota bacterium]
MTAPGTVLGIETSCDETAAAVVRLGEDGAATIVSETVRSQVAEHAPFGGVVPEIAARAHADLTDRVVADAMEKAGLDYSDLDGVAATSGPGLIGGVLVGMMTGKAIAMAAGIPFIPVNHLEGHALSPRLTEPCPFPYLLLLVSGGHCQFLEVRGLGDYRRLGTTIDDAAGEAFDKTAKHLGLGFPGGPAVERAAASGDPEAVPLPRPLLNRPGLDMSFAGLKTAVARAAEAEPLSGARIADICAGFQKAVCDILGEKSRRALEGFDVGSDACPEARPERRFVVAGGVAANTPLRARLEAVAAAAGAKLMAPPLRYCTDNGAMIALAGAERLRAGAVPDQALDFRARPRWPLDEAAAAARPAYGSGEKGAKA